MKLLTKLAGTWKQAKAYWFKAPVTWTLPGWASVRKVFIKANGEWERYYVRNGIVVYALGLLQQQAPNAYGGVSINGRETQRGQRSYNLAQFNGNSEIARGGSYDIRLPLADGTNVEIERMAKDLNDMVDGQVFVLYSYDEPKYEHMHPKLIAAVERVGGTDGIYSQAMAYRGAYILIGKVGFPKYFEQYVGGEFGEDPGSGDPFAYISKRFTIVNNVVIMQPDNWAWGQSTKRDIHVAYSLGGFQTVYPMSKAGLWLNDTVQEERKEITPLRSYTLITFTPNNAVTFAYAYDVYLDKVNGVLKNTNDLIAELNRMAQGQVFILFSHDEPKYGHTHPALLDAVYRVGGTPSVYGQPMGYRGAYMLIGKVGSPAAFEKYTGSDLGDGDAFGDPMAAIKMSFFVENNEIHLVQ